MKYKCCEHLLHQIVFDQDEIKPCCASSMNKEVAKFVENFDGSNFDVDNYLKQRKCYVDIFKSGNIPNCCEGCPLIKEKVWDDEKVYFNRIIMANIAKCSCNCIYCVYTYYDEKKKAFYNTRKYYDIKPILVDLRNKNLISDDLVLLIGGGECTEFSKGELEWLIYFSTFYNGKIQILSSGINYSKAIEYILKSGNVELSISPDSGTKEMYEKIKRVKTFDQVWKNIKDYINASQNNTKARIEVKYIIIPNFNDNLKEVKAFINKVRETNCKNIHVDIEHYWYAQNRDKPVPNNIKEIVTLFNNNKEFFVSFSAETETWLIN